MAVNVSPNSVVTLGILTLRVKGLCVIEVSRGRVRLVRCYFQHFHASRNPRSAFRLRMLAESGWLSLVLGSRRSAAHFCAWWPLLVTGARGKPRVPVVQSRIFVTGARVSTCGLQIRGSLPRKLRFGIWMSSVEAFLRRNALAGLWHVNLEVPSSWRAQHFVNLKVQSSWRSAL